MEFYSAPKSPKAKLRQTVADYHLYGEYIWFSGAVLIFFSLFFFVYQFYRLIEVSERPEILFGSYRHRQKLQEQYMEVYDHYVEQANSKNPIKKFAHKSEDDRAVILGFRQSLEFIFVIDCLLCIALVVKGVLMMQSTSHVSEITKIVEINGSEELPELYFSRLQSKRRLELQQHGVKYAPARSKYHAFLTAQVAVFFLACFSGILHIILIFQMRNRTKHIRVSYNYLHKMLAKNPCTSCHKGLSSTDHMAVEYAKIIQSHDDDEENSHKLKLFLINDGQQADLLESILIFAILILLVGFCNRIFRLYYNVSGKLMDAISQKAATI